MHRAYLEALREYGVAEWSRHVSGYSMGIGFPPLWGELRLLSVNAGVDTELQPGMVLHLLSGVCEPELGIPHVGLSDCLLITEQGAERLIDMPEYL